MKNQNPLFIHSPSVNFAPFAPFRGDSVLPACNLCNRLLSNRRKQRKQSLLSLFTAFAERSEQKAEWSAGFRIHQGASTAYLMLFGSERRFSIGFQSHCDGEADCKSALQTIGISCRA